MGLHWLQSKRNNECVERHGLEREKEGKRERERAAHHSLVSFSNLHWFAAASLVSEWRMSQRRGRQGRERAMLAQDLCRSIFSDPPREQRQQRGDTRQVRRTSKEDAAPATRREVRRQLWDRFSEVSHAATDQCGGTSGCAHPVARRTSSRKSIAPNEQRKLAEARGTVGLGRLLRQGANTDSWSRSWGKVAQELDSQELLTTVGNRRRQAHMAKAAKP